jgi:hypothetical protein
VKSVIDTAHAGKAAYAQSLGTFITGTAWVYLVLSALGCILLASQTRLAPGAASSIDVVHPHVVLAGVCAFSSFFFFLALLAVGCLLRVQGATLERVVA